MKDGISRMKRRLRLLLASRSERRHSMVGPMYLWDMKRSFQIQFLERVGLQPEHYLLDLGCGTLRGGIPIIRHLQKGHYFGVEIRVKALDEGRKELRDEKLEYKEPVLILADDISSLDIERKFDFIWAFSVLIHMEDNILNNTLDFVHKHLKKSGRFYANVNIGARADGTWETFPCVWRSLVFYEEIGLQNGLCISDMGTLESLGHLANNGSDQQRMIEFKTLDT